MNKMKKMKVNLFAFALCTMLTVVSFAQSDKDESTGGFKKDKLFTGGTVALGFGSGSTSFGLGPYFGYSINKYVDVALSLNYNYVSQRDYLDFGDKIRQSVIGPGIFTRLYPVKFLFAHAQYEQNFIKVKYIPAYAGNPSRSQSVSAPSFLVGPGFASGRDADNNTFYYISILFDVAKNPNSPYIDGRGRVTPIYRAGINIGLFGGSGSDNGGGRKRNNY
jgi:hypothetical protein